jgi:hypothetical protein
MKHLFLLLFVTGFFGALSAQELNCRVVVNADRAQTTEREIFRDMEVAFAQFMNERKWTNHVYKPGEKIKCQLIIGIESMPTINTFTATVQVQSVRPVYQTNLETSVLALTLNYADRDWQFEYSESQPLEFNENTFTNNITSILAFYAYIIIGMDYDTFSHLGGNPYFERAMNIAMTAQQTNRPGWQQFTSPPRNRYWLIENLMNPQLRPVREGMYEYHRQALDTFLQNPEEGRKIALEVLKKIQRADGVRPNTYLITLFLYSKSTELAHMFSDGDMNVRREAYSILTSMDPTNTDRYRRIIGGG